MRAPKLRRAGASFASLVFQRSNVLHDAAMSQKSPLPRIVRWPLFSVGFVLSLSAGCSDLIPPDPYSGAIDPSGFYRLYKFQPSSKDDPADGCLIPRRGWDGATLSDTARFYYMGALFPSQLDLSGAFDVSRPWPPSVYALAGCTAPERRQDPGDFDIRIHNYDKRVQYPILSQGLFPLQVGGASEPTATSSSKPDGVPLSYKPFHLVVQATLGPSVRDRMGCNDVKRELSLLERAGWDRSNKAFPDGGTKDIDFAFPSRDQIKAGTVRFKDWPMVNVGVPVGRSLDVTQSCPFVKDSKATYPKTLDDSSSSFQFPSQSWFRGLLSGSVESIVVSNGSYLADSLSTGMYHVRFTPDPVVFPGAVPLYFQTGSTWSTADLIGLPCYLNSADIDADTVNGSDGNATIFGNIIIDTTFLKSTVAFEGALVLLKDQVTHQTVAHAFSGVDGNYALTGVPDGDFYILVDVPYIPQTDTFFVSIQGGVSGEGFDYAILTNGIEMNGEPSLGIADAKELVVETYPNPADELVYITLNSNETVSARLTTMNGKWVKTVELGNGKQAIRTDELPAGIYLLTINSAQPVRLVVQH